MSNLLDRSSLVLTPTAYNNGEALCIKPDDASGDFQFSRNSAATRVNAQGLVENVQILSSNLVQNGSFSEEGVQEVSNGSFTNGSTDWNLGTGWSIGENKATVDNTVNANLDQSCLTSGKIYKVSFEISDLLSGGIIVGDIVNPGAYDATSNGSHTFYYTATNSTLRVRAYGNPCSITNISVKEVGQNWDLLNGTITDKYNASLTSYQNGIRVNPFTYTGTVKVTFDLVVTSGSCKFVAGGSNEQIYSTSGTKEIIVTNPSRFEFNAFNLGWVGTLDNVSAIQITDDTNLPRINYEGFSYQDVLGSEEVVNGGFDNGGSNWSNIGGFAVFENSSVIFENNAKIYQGVVSDLTKTYNIEIEFSSISGNGIQLLVGNGNSFVSYSVSDIINNGNKINIAKESFIGSGILFIYSQNSSTSAVINNVSVKEYLGQSVVPDSGCGSWLFEPQSTNLVTDSEDYSQWTPTGVSLTSNSTTSPDGLINGTLLSTNGGTSNRYIRNFGLPTSATIKVLSVYAKANLSNFIQLLHSGDAQGYVNFDVSNGVVGTSGTKTTGEIKSVGNGWYRCIAYFDSSNVFGSSSFVALVTSNSAGFGGGQTSDSLNVYIWGSQYEEQSYATSYIPTEGTQKTRNQDLCTNGATGAGLINSTEGVLYAEIAALATNSTGLKTISIEDGTISNQVCFFYSTVSNEFKALIRQSGNKFFVTTILSNSTDYIKVALLYKSGGSKLYINGSLIFSNTVSFSFTNPLSILKFGGAGLGNFFGKTKALAVLPYLTDQELTELTTI